MHRRRRPAGSGTNTPEGSMTGRSVAAGILDVLGTDTTPPTRRRIRERLETRCGQLVALKVHDALENLLTAGVVTRTGGVETPTYRLTDRAGVGRLVLVCDTCGMARPRSVCKSSCGGVFTVCHVPERPAP